jgi:hypothetical protein
MVSNCTNLFRSFGLKVLLHTKNGQPQSKMPNRVWHSTWLLNITRAINWKSQPTLLSYLRSYELAADFRCQQLKLDRKLHSRWATSANDPISDIGPMPVRRQGAVIDSPTRASTTKVIAIATFGVRPSSD